MERNIYTLGDWVEYGNKPYKIKSVSSRIVKLIGWYSDFVYEVIKPIRLTKDFLDFNGFIYNDTHYYLFIGDEGEGFISVQLDLNELKISVDGYEIDMKCIYVHELQQMLRICGLNDIANLLKL